MSLFLDPDAKVEWYKIFTDEYGLIQEEFLTDSNRFLKSPITIEDLGRYRCVATNNYGSRYRDAVLSKPNNFVEFLVYGFVDKQQAAFNWNDNYLAVSKFKSENVFNSTSNQSNNFVHLLVRNLKKNINLGQSVYLKCSKSNFKINILTIQIFSLKLIF